MAIDFIVPGINIQWPWSQLLLSGRKTVETRSYKLPKKFENQWLGIVETPGPLGRKNGVPKASTIGFIRFSDSFRYDTKANWKADFDRHQVPEGDKNFGFNHSRPKWGWLVDEIVVLPAPIAAPPERGIVWAKPFPVTLHEQTSTLAVLFRR